MLMRLSNNEGFLLWWLLILELILFWLGGLLIKMFSLFLTVFEFWGNLTSDLYNSDNFYIEF